ncbi:hypothetical protein BT93_L2414 [Corymbia citriodora subsp. variegata]|uniref:TIR domain-containing protein n=1 Tax=Corymbia citriodora subsp. variegata TaxID=360336 RepID=A0A8T0CJM5_CORYI|nr:hypothetical protein BT93_L2414 [Corymbia citriodora subsp. variegata]
MDGSDAQSSQGAEFEVFLSFRGPDTRMNFADCLYHALDRAGICVFRDDEEIRKGEEIEGQLKRAIETSSICIPIFSKNYAVSAWCLRELAYMVDRKAIILPVFFDVKPRDAKLKTKLYQDPLQKHEEKYGCEVVQRWKEALEKVAGMRGWNLKDNGHDELIKSMVAEVSIKLNKRDKNLPDHLVGIQDRVKDVMRLLDEGSLDVRYLTTLARVIFNQIYSQFHGCSFLSGVQEATKDGKIVQLQKQLLSELLNFKPVKIFDFDARINQIKWKFRQKKVLIVLDDLDEWDQLSKLAAMGDWFGLGSRIIITTRDTNNMAIEEYNIYQMTEFKHAFGMDSPPHDYDDISCNITSMTSGLPLALEVIGCSLYHKRKPIWKEMLKKLEIYPYYMWKALDFYPKIEINFLIDASLIKIDDDDRLLMHDLLRDIGREIVQQEDLKVYGKHSRLWQPKIALEEVLKTRMANRDLKVMHLIRCYLLTTPDFSICLKLRILVFAEHCPESPQIDSSIGKLERLKRLEIIAARIQQSKLSGSPHFDFCIMPFAMCHLKNLSTLKLERQCMQELHPSIGELASLTCLSLKYCYHLRKLPNSIGKLRSLLELNLSVTRIKKLPNSIGDLKVLEKMNLGWSKIMGLPNSIGGLESLLDLNLEHSKITALPAFIGYLKRLKRLFMAFSKIRELPNSIGDLKNLEELHLGHTKLTELPNSIGVLESLLTLDLWKLKITVLPASIGYLKRLKRLCMYFSKIKELPNSIGDLKSLEMLELGWTHIMRLNMSRGQIRELPKAIGMLENLEMLAYHDSSNMDMTLPPQLLRLFLSCNDLGSLPRLPLSLSDLTLMGVKSPIIRPLSSELRYLSHLTLSECGSREIVIEQLESLRSLGVHDCKSLVTLALSSLGRLEVLEIKCCPQLIEIRHLGEMELPKLSKLHKLGGLTVSDCRSLQCLPDLPNSLLSIWNWSSTETSPERSKHSLLRILNLSHCESLQGSIPNLWRREIHACPLVGESGDVLDSCWRCS